MVDNTFATVRTLRSARVRLMVVIRGRESTDHGPEKNFGKEVCQRKKASRLNSETAGFAELSRGARRN